VTETCEVQHGFVQGGFPSLSVGKGGVVSLRHVNGALFLCTLAECGRLGGTFSFEKRTSPRPPEEKPGAFRFRPGPPTTKGDGPAGPSSFGNPTPGLRTRAALSVSGERGKRSSGKSCHAPERTHSFQTHWIIDAHPKVAFLLTVTAQPLAALPPYGCGVLLAGNGRFLFAKTKRKWGFITIPHAMGVQPVLLPRNPPLWGHQKEPP